MRSKKKTIEDVKEQEEREIVKRQKESETRKLTSKIMEENSTEWNMR